MVDDEIVILDTRSANYLALNRAGAVLWPLLVDGAAVDTLAAALVDAFGITAEQAETDVAAFVAALRDSGLVEPQQEAAS